MCVCQMRMSRPAEAASCSRATSTLLVHPSAPAPAQSPGCRLAEAHDEGRHAGAGRMAEAVATRPRSSRAPQFKMLIPTVHTTRTLHDVCCGHLRWPWWRPSAAGVASRRVAWASALPSSVRGLPPVGAVSVNNIYRTEKVAARSFFFFALGMGFKRACAWARNLLLLRCEVGVNIFWRCAGAA